MGIALAFALALFAGAHVGLVGQLTRAPRVGARARWARAVVAFFVPPLAPWWGWEAGLRRTTIVWSGALALYTLGVIATATAR
jgi:hypothetical protein